MAVPAPGYRYYNADLRQQGQLYFAGEWFKHRKNPWAE